MFWAGFLVGLLVGVIGLTVAAITVHSEDSYK